MKYLLNFKLFESDNNYNVIILVGLPGSGKSTYAQNYVKEHSDYVIYDDFKIYDAIKEIGKSNMIISDGVLIEYPDSFIKNIETKCLENNCTLQVYYFENNPDKCKINIINRWNNMSIEEKENNAHKNPDRLIKQLNWYSSKYNIPDNANILPIFNA